MFVIQTCTNLSFKLKSIFSYTIEWSERRDLCNLLRELSRSYYRIQYQNSNEQFELFKIQLGEEHWKAMGNRKSVLVLTFQYTIEIEFKVMFSLLFANRKESLLKEFRYYNIFITIYIQTWCETKTIVSCHKILSNFRIPNWIVWDW